MHRIFSSIFSIVIAGLILFAAYGYSTSALNIEKSDERLHILEQATLASLSLHSALIARLQLVKGLVGLRKSHSNIDDEFYDFSHELAMSQDGVLSLQYAKNGIVSHVYPRDGNEKIIGHNLLKDQKRNGAVIRGILSQEFVIAGPLDLIQGGRAIIGRYPIFLTPPLPGKEMESFWGFAIIIIDVSSLFDESGITELADKVQLSIRGIDGLGKDGAVFFGNQGVFDQDPVLINVQIPNGSWQMAITPIGGWMVTVPQRNVILAIGILIAALSGILAFVFLERSAVLEKKVKQATKSLRKSHAEYRKILDGIKNEYFIYQHDLNNVYTYLSPSITNLLGYSTSELLNTQQSLMSDHPDNVDIFEIMGRVSSNAGSQSFSVVLKHADGTDRDFEILEFPTFSETKEITGIQGIARDVTDKRESQVRQMRAQAMFENTDEAILISNSVNEIISVNPAFMRITGYTEEEILGKSPSILSSQRQGKEFYKTMWESIRDTGSWNGEIWNRRKNGDFFPEWLSISTIKDDKNKTLNYIAIFRDISKQIFDADLIQKQTTTDALTGLPNRILFMDRLSQLIESYERDTNQFAILHVDIDNFKLVNETRGHSVGDKLLIEVSKRLKSDIRKSDTVCRLGSDEFVILLRGIHDVSIPVQIAEKIIKSCSEVFFPGDEEMFISCSIGVAMYPVDDRNSIDLMAHANMAMYRAKELGRNNFQFFSIDMAERIQNVSNLKTKMRKAIANSEFEAFYQPIVSCKSGKIEKAEALVRWIGSDQKLIFPDEFIPVAEDAGLIVPIGAQMLKQVCNDLPEFQSTSRFLESVSLNCSIRELKEANYVENFMNTIHSANIDIDLLVLEITESLFMDVHETVVPTNIRAFKNIGLKTALDDFGTGYSSLGYLQKFPTEFLKIDKSFVQDFETNAANKRLVNTIIKMAHGFHMKTIAEGVETESQLSLLKAMGCDYIQGYLISRPVRKKEFIGLLEWDNKNDLFAKAV